MTAPADPSPFDLAAARVLAGGDHHAEARALVASMTTEEKLGCLDGDTEFWSGIVDMVAGGYHSHPWPAAEVDRLGIPGIRFADGPRGCVIGTATCFPVSMARGATFDPELEERIGRAIGTELRAMGATYTGAVCMNLLRHPGWGRAQETYGEDPHHVGVMAAALTRGLQTRVMACMKHFACNSMEEARFRVDVRVDDRALHEVYLPHFRRVAAEGVASVMSAYNSVNGHWCGENAVLLTDILRTEWGWDGFVTSDFIAGLHDPVLSVTAGLEIEMPFRQQRAQHLPAALESGDLAIADVDARVEATVATLLRFAGVVAPTPGRSVLASPEHRALAREAAVRSTVLLRNEGRLLPVSPGLGRVAVLGRLAAVANLGDGGSSDVYPPEVTTLFDGVRGAFPSADVVHHDADASIATGADLTVVVVGFTKDDEGEFIDVGTSESMMTMFPPPPEPPPPGDAALGPVAPEHASGPVAAEPGGGLLEPEPQTFAPGGDRRSLRLGPDDEALIRRAVAVCPDTVVAVMGGSAVVMPWLDEVPATLIVWYPGMEGGAALGDVLTGVHEPGGRLPFAVPFDEADLVDFDPDADTVVYDLFHGQWKLDRDGVPAHQPFGAGLGYTSITIESGSLRLQRDGTTPTTGWVEVDVSNVGDREGSTVVLLSAGLPGSAVDRPDRRLVGFSRVTLDSGARTTVGIPFDLADLAVRHDGGWFQEPGRYVLEVGSDAATVVASVGFDVPGPE
ncbi:MAG: glycoside hydrolase family 3 N-terminal domain-containing protein [Acidimicrobiales bacterium]|jgi:beta-glucosidase